MCIGYWLDGSGWRMAIECPRSNVTSSVMADAMIGGKHVTRTRCAHQVIAAALYALHRAAYDKYTDTHTGGVRPFL